MTAEARFAPAAERNSPPILDVLKRVLPPHGLVLEIASGTGQHAAYMGHALPALTWQPSDPDASARRSIAAWIAQEKLANVLPPVALDVHAWPWPIQQAHAIVCINMIHIAAWSATGALFAAAKRVLPQNAVVYLYGPYRVGGRHTAPSNAAFDRWLQGENAEWGVRDLERVVEMARADGFDLEETVQMPANNLSVVFRHTRAEDRTAQERTNE